MSVCPPPHPSTHKRHENQDNPGLCFYLKIIIHRSVLTIGDSIEPEARLRCKNNEENCAGITIADNYGSWFKFRRTKVGYRRSMVKGSLSS